MKKVNYYYSTKLTFDDYVHDHSFALRVIPPETDTQKILSCSLDISPYVSAQQTVDAFGNNVTAGYLKGDHRFLDFEIKGIAEVDHTKHRTDYMPCYLYQSQYTVPDDELKSFYGQIKAKCTGTIQDKAAFLCSELGGVLMQRAFGYFRIPKRCDGHIDDSGTGVCAERRSVSGLFAHTHLAAANGRHSCKIHRRTCVL